MIALNGRATAADQTYQFDIPAESLGQALTAFSKASSQQIVFSEEVTNGKSTAGLHGRYTAFDALSALLAGTNLAVDTNAAGVMMVRSKNAQAAQNERAAEKSNENTETVEVTGTRLLDAPAEGSAEKRSYNKAAIERSGQSTVTDFLRTLPEVSQFSLPPLNSAGGQTSIQLRGFPVGTTLVLLDGHHAPNSAYGQGNAFDVNNIPEGLLERIDVLPLGSSAIYGSDALAGAVNFVLRRDLDGFEASASRGSASRYEQYNATASFGQQFDGGDFGIGISYQGNGHLLESDRPELKGIHIASMCSPGTVQSTTAGNLPGLTSSVAAISPGITGKPTTSQFTPGMTNLCPYGYLPLVPQSSRLSALAYGDWRINDHVTAYGTILFGHHEEDVSTVGVNLTSRSIPASNAFNPFGVPVLVSARYPTPAAQSANFTDFLDVELGVRGDIFSSWNWDLNGTITQDHDSVVQGGSINSVAFVSSLASSDPATAFNPFATDAGSANAKTFLLTTDSADHDRSIVAEFVARGPLFSLPAGAVQASFGAQYENQNFLSTGQIFSATTGLPAIRQLSGSRNIESVFGEIRAPLVSSLTGDEQPFAAFSAAVRWDSFSDFGETVNPQFGLEIRPVHPILLRGTYSEAFRAPTLYSLYTAQTTSQNALVDPAKNNSSVSVPVTSGGNPNLKPETGNSYSFGAVWSDSPSTGNLTASLTFWHLEENNRITNLTPQTVLSNAALFPTNVVRDASGNLVSVNTEFLNFGQLIAEGVDADATYPFATDYGNFTPAISATVTSKFSAALLPGQPLVDRLNAATFNDVWAPAWKATTSVGWELREFSASLTGRYLGQYLDYQTPVNNNHLGNYWLWDASATVKIGSFIERDEPLLKNAGITISAVNILDRGPRFSNFESGALGYDAQQYNILGRYVTVKLSTAW